jgi:hypothetical protein
MQHSNHAVETRRLHNINAHSVASGLWQKAAGTQDIPLYANQTWEGCCSSTCCVSRTLCCHDTHAIAANVAAKDKSIPSRAHLV